MSAPACWCTDDCTCFAHVEQRSVHCGATTAPSGEITRLREQRDEARGWAKLLLAPYAGDGVREEARQVIAEWEAADA